MAINLIERIGDVNPQMWREIKGRLKPRNIVITVAISLITQFSIFQYFLTQLPSEPLPGQENHPISNTYCTGERADNYSSNFSCIRDSLGNFIINWEPWNRHLFVCLSFVGICSLLVVGSYMLINDLYQEERRGTLNLIRLSPQSHKSILIGKILGVPILLYLAILLAVPLHFWVGLSAHIPLFQIVEFDILVIACCILFYSTVLLYSLFSNWLGFFQPWLGAGVVLAFLWLNYSLTNTPLYTATSWLILFPPFDLVLKSDLGELEWYGLPIGANRSILFLFALLNFALWTYWIWQGLNRCFRNPNTTIFSKGQSYLLTACLEISLMGFAVSKYLYSSEYSHDYDENGLESIGNLLVLYCSNLLLFLVLIVILSPHRQVLQDWARYRHQNQGKSLIKDLIFGEKSPALVAIGINLGIAIALINIWSLSSGLKFDYRFATLVSLAFVVTLIMLYAVLVQLLLFVRLKNNIIWAIGALSATIFIPPILLAVFQLNPGQGLGFLWYFSVLVPLAFTFGNGTSGIAIFMAALGQWTILGLLTVKLTQKLRIAGESATKALLDERRALPSKNL